MSMFTFALVALLVALALGLIRALRGPNTFDRVIAANSIGTLSMLLLAVHGFWEGRPEFLDIAVVYGLLNFVGTIAVLKVFRFPTLTQPVETLDTPDEAGEPGR